MRKPLFIATLLSLALHSAMVFALVLMPDVAPPPERNPPTEVSLAPDYAAPSPQPETQAPPLPPSKPVEQVAGDVEETQPQETVPAETQLALRAEAPGRAVPETPPAITDVAPVLPPTSPPILPLTLPSAVPTAEALKPADGAPAAPPESAPADIAATGPKPAPAANAAPADTTAPSSPEAVASASVSETQAAPPAASATAPPPLVTSSGPAPLFPLEPPSSAASRPPPPETLSLPVIASDEGPLLPDAAAQALEPSELPAISDAGPGGTAGAAGAGEASRARPFQPPAAKRPTSAGRGTGAAGGAGEIYDPGVRARYSTGLFAYLRRKLVFPAGGGATGTTTVRFILEQNGRIGELKVVGSSGSPELDSEALAIVRRAAPFPRFPDGFGSSQLEVTLPVTFR